MKNPFAVITGASNGIGLELAKQFGSQGYDLLIVAGSDTVFEAQEELEDQGFTVEAIKANLATYAGVENFYDQIRAERRPVDVIVINAGTLVEGPFVETEIKEEINLINLNIVSAVHLTKNIIQDMKKRGQGKILFNPAIISGISQHKAVYGASRAFISSFVKSLKHELKDSNISISILSPKEGLLTKLQEYALKVLPLKTKMQISDNHIHQ